MVKKIVRDPLFLAQGKIYCTGIVKRIAKRISWS